MNWWLEADPEEVSSYRKVAFYGDNNSFRGEKCRGCDFQEKCDFCWDITDDERYMKLHAQCEEEDGYVRDDCVWERDISSYGTMGGTVKYDNGTIFSYSVNAAMPYEGQLISFTGEDGRLDVRVYKRQPWEVPYEADFRLTKSFGKTETWKVGEETGIDLGQGGHGGADMHLKNMLFKLDHPDPMGLLAGSRAGVMASLVRIAARRSIETGRQVKIKDLLDTLPEHEALPDWGYWQ